MLNLSLEVALHNQHNSSPNVSDKTVCLFSLFESPMVLLTSLHAKSIDIGLQSSSQQETMQYEERFTHPNSSQC